jgi:lipopolysaccharide export system protein LptC
LALGSYWLVKNTPLTQAPFLEPLPKHVPDYFMRDFGVRSFDAAGKLTNEVFGKELRHFPDTDTTEIDAPRILKRAPDGRSTVATAKRAITNADGSEVQLMGGAYVVREAGTTPDGKPLPRLEIRSEFLHSFTNLEQVKTDQPVSVKRGDDSFSGDAMVYDNLEGVLELTGRSKVIFAARKPTP